MKANGLRIGNYFKSNIIQQVELTHLEFLLNPKMDHSLMQPIPLNEEWLLKFGFVSQYLYWDKGIFEIAKSDNGYILSINCNEYVYGNEFRYVHQLQNLFFALTGEELTVNA